MNKLPIVALAAGLVSFSIPAFSQMGMMGPGNMMGRGNMMGMSMARHHYVMVNGIDPEYASKVNPLPSTKQNAESGRRLFDQNCAQCHGPAGRGDGLAGANLSPPPADVAATSKMPMATDGYLYWAISEGGVAVRSAMPPFKGNLKENEIWEIITYLRML
jgi:mono/diheme cytochrome c family protein